MFIPGILSLLTLLASEPYQHGSGASFYNSRYQSASTRDSLKENQVLYRGKVWRNLHTSVVGDQFLFVPDYLTGSVSISGKTFRNIPLKYDIYTDELITSTNQNIMLQLNKEMVDSFSVTYSSGIYNFIKTDSASDFSGYINVLYEGGSTFYAKYRKLIELLAVDRKFDRFYQVNRMYLLIDSIPQPFSGRGQLYRLMGSYKKQVRSYVSKSGIFLSRRNPESFIPVIKFYDSLKP